MGLGEGFDEGVEDENVGGRGEGGEEEKGGAEKAVGLARADEPVADSRVALEALPDQLRFNLPELNRTTAFLQHKHRNALRQTTTRHTRESNFTIHLLIYSILLSKNHTSSFV